MISKNKKVLDEAVEQAITGAKESAPTAIVKIDGKDYTLCFDMESFIRAEDTLAAQGNELHLLAALPSLTNGNCRTLFIAALQRHHEDLTFAERCALWRFDTAFALANSVADLYVAAIKRPEVQAETNPPEASSAT